jgi:hypothetical protein
LRHHRRRRVRGLGLYPGRHGSSDKGSGPQGKPASACRCYAESPRAAPDTKDPA